MSNPIVRKICSQNDSNDMVPFPKVVASNESIASTFPNDLVAVFVGGTSGVGEYTLLKLAKYAPKLRVYIVGRSQEAGDRIITECKQLNPGGKFEFIKSDISILVNVDDVCRKIKSKEVAINILFQSQGTMSFKSSMFGLTDLCLESNEKELICCRDIRRLAPRRRSSNALTHALHSQSPPPPPESLLSPPHRERSGWNHRGRYRSE